MNILLLTRNLQQYAGSEKQIFELYDYFKKHNHRVIVFAQNIGMPIQKHFQTQDITTDITQIKSKNLTSFGDNIYNFYLCFHN